MSNPITPAAPAANPIFAAFGNLFGSSAPAAPAAPAAQPVAPVAQPVAPVAPVAAPAASAAPVVAPVVVANPADVAKQAAMSKLFNTAVDNLWNDSVTQASGLWKVVGLFKYYIGLYSASKADTAEVKATIVDLNNKAVALVSATAVRYLTPAEAAKVAPAGLNFNDGNNQLVGAAKNVAADTAEKAFYEVFKKRCEQLAVPTSSVAYGVHASAAMKKVEEFAKTQEVVSDIKVGTKNKTFDTANLLPIKLETVNESFNKRIYVDMVEGYANLAIGEITATSFKERVAQLKAFFPSNSIVDIEATLRQALKAKFDTAFDSEKTEYLRNVNNTKIPVIKQQLHDQYSVEKPAIEAELAALRGTTGWNGTIHTAAETLANAQRDLEASKVVFLREFGTAFGVNASSPVEALIALPVAFAGIPALDTARTDLVAKLAVYNTAKTAHDALIAKLTELAQYDINGRVVGGKLKIVNDNLDDTALTAKAQAEARTLGRFYGELNKPVTNDNKAARHTALRQVIGN